MEIVQIEDINAQVEEQDSVQIPIFDLDYWSDQHKNLSTDKSIVMSDTNAEDKSLKLVIQNQINETSMNFCKTIKIEKPKEEIKDKIKQKLSNSKIILKEGYLQKKTDGFLFKWRDRYIVLTSEKLISFADQQKQKIISCVNLKIIHSEATLTSNELTLDFKGQCENIILRSQNKQQLIEWKELIDIVLEYHNKQSKVMLKTMNKFIYGGKDIITQSQFLKEAETGDILLFYTQNFGAKVQRFLTNSDYDHVAMVVKLKNKELMIFQSNQMHGVSLYEWKQYISYFNLYGKITLRKLNYLRKMEAQTNLLSFVKKNLGKKYELSAFKLLKLESDFNWQNLKDNRGYFCSELIAKALKSIGLLDDRKFSGRYWPVDFAEANNLELKKGATLSKELTILLNKHTKQSR